MIGQEVGNYILQAKLGEGGMGEVYLARHKNLETLAAVKVMTPAFSHDAKLRERFSREARTQAQLRHPNIAQVFDHIEHDGRWFMIIEYMENGTLEDVLENRQGPVPEAQALTWARQALEGLNHAHGKGVVHRDIKPANLLLNERGEVAVTDFGIAMVLGAQRLTRTGASIGTPEYMSPEQIQGRADLDHRTDVYSMGIVLYELLGGRVPFEAASTFEVMERQVKEPPPPLRDLRSDVSPQLEALLMKALAKGPQERYTTCGEFAAAIAAYERGEVSGSRVTVFESLDGSTLAPPPVPQPVSKPYRSATVMVGTDTHDPPPPVPKRPLGPIIIGVAAVLVALVAAYFWWTSQPRDGDEPLTIPSTISAAAETAKGEAEHARLAASAAAAAASEAEAFAKRARDESARARDASSSGQCSTAQNAASSCNQEASKAEQAANTADQEASKAETAVQAAKTAQAEARGKDEVARTGRPLNLRLASLIAPVAHADESDDEARLLEEIATAVGSAEEAATEARSSAVDAASSAEAARQAATLAEQKVNSCRSLPPPSSPPPTTFPPPQPPPPPPPPPPRRQPPKDPVVAVLVIGDPVLGASLEEQLEKRLLRSGFDVRDERGSLELDNLLSSQGDRVAFADVLPILAREGFNVAVVVKIEIGDQRDMRFHGQSMTMTSARLRLNSWLLPTGRALGRGWSERVEYTELSADAKAKQAFIGASVDLVQAIRSGWDAFRQGSR